MANDTGSNYWFIPGGETPAPPVAPPVQEPVSPFPTVNYLQDPVQLLMNPGESTAPVSRPSFTPQAAPTAMRLDMPQTIVPPTTPVTPQLPTTTPEPPATTPELPEPPSDIPTSTPDVTAPDQIYGRIGDPLPGQPGVRVGDPIPPDNDGNQWVWDLRRPELGYFVPPTPKPPSTPPIITPPRESIVLPPEAVTTVPVQPIVTPQPPVTPQPSVTPQPPVTEPEPLLPEVVTINRPTFPIYEPLPSRGPVTIPGTAVSSSPVLKTIEQMAQFSPTTVQIPSRQESSVYPSRFDYINYDPNEILAAAMRVLRGRGAGRSLME